MFDPIYAFTETSFGLFVLFVWLFINLAIFLNWSVRNAVRFVKDEDYVMPLGQWFDGDADYQGITIAISVMLGFIPVAILTFIINWLWFPCVVIAGIIAMLFMARGVVRLKKSLEEHKADKEAHK